MLGTSSGNRRVATRFLCVDVCIVSPVCEAEGVGETSETLEHLLGVLTESGSLQILLVLLCASRNQAVLPLS